MSLAPQEQFKKFLEDSKNVLIFIPENPSADAVGSAWALSYFLEKKGIDSAIAFSNHLAEKFNFLPRPKNILAEISGARDFVLSFDTSRNKIIKVRKEEIDDRFNIYVTPQKGAIDPRDFSFILAQFKYDLVIVIDSPDPEKLGKLYTENSDLFFEIPVINIDHRSENDNFGQINLVDVTASSCAEILTYLLDAIDPKLIDEKIATCLLTGLIGATDSFQKKNTAPKTLSVASALMDRGANQQEIVRWLYKTQPLHIIKLWGRVMANINWEESVKLIWSAITVNDFVQSRANPQDLISVMEKLAENYSDGKIIMVIYNDTPNTAIALVRSEIEQMKKLETQLGGNISRGLLEIKIQQSNLEETGKEIAEKIKNSAAAVQPV